MLELINTLEKNEFPSNIKNLWIVDTHGQARGTLKQFKLRLT